MSHLPGTTVKPALRVDVYSHHIKFTQFDDLMKHVLLQYCKGLGHYGLKMVAPRQFVRAITCVYAASTNDRREFRFHINQREEIMRHVLSREYTLDQILIVEHDLYVPSKVVYKHVTSQVPYDYQIPMIEYLADPGKTKILTIQTGAGKTFCFHKAIALIEQRVALVIKGMYVEQWIETTKKNLGLKAKEIMVVRGSKDLQALIDIALAGELHANFIIITSKTLFNYYKSYESAQQDMFEYNCLPEDLWRILDVGVRGIDEVHQEFHANFREDLYSHVPKTINLTATLDSDDAFINRMYMVMFPPECRPPAIEHKKYIDVLALEYRLEDFRRVRFIGANKMYSHVKYEQCIMRYPDLTRQYFKMISDIAFDQFIAVFEPGQRMLIFCSTVEMCTELTKYMWGKYPDMAIGRYTQEDDFAVLKLNDISITTLKSAGTAVDVDGLRVCLMTDSISSKQANIQVVGRLRELKRWPDISPLFVYIYAGNVDKHKQYAVEKQEKLRDKVATQRTLLTSYHLGTPERNRGGMQMSGSNQPQMGHRTTTNPLWHKAQQHIKQNAQSQSLWKKW
jgi:superfamily II DNA or RNA helicase